MGSIPKVPFGTSLGQQAFLQRLASRAERPGRGPVPPSPPTNMAVTSLPGAVLVQFTRSDGESYVLLWNSVPSINGATRIDLGSANEYTVNFGDENVVRYFWLKAKKGELESILTSARTGETGALNTPVTPPEPPPGSEWPAVSDETEQIEPGYPDWARYMFP